MTTIRTDVCVVGGGPSGASAALRLASLGHEVVLLERGDAPKRREGESLTPGVWPILGVLGLVDRVVSEGFRPSVESSVLWSGEREERVEQRAREPGLIVDRARFDGLLRMAAEERGARVLSSVAARRVDRAGAGGGVRIEAETAGRGSLVVEARFVVDASGRAGFLPGARRPTAARTLALHGYLRGEGLPDVTQVEAVENGWLWGAKLADGTFSAMVFVDPEAVAGAGRAGLEPLFRARLAASRLFEAGARADLVGGVRARDATAYADPGSIGVDFIKVGEAGFALDPLSSTGVEKAMQTALTGSLAVHTILARPHDAQLAVAFQADRQREAVERHAAWAAEHYREPVRFADRPFWRRRASPAVHSGSAPAPAPVPAPLGGPDPAALLHCPVALSAEAQLVETPCIVGDFIEARGALQHPSLGRPVAFLGGVEVASLLGEVERGGTLLDIVRRWSPGLPMQRGLEIAAWLLARGVLGAAPR